MSWSALYWAASGIAIASWGQGNGLSLAAGIGLCVGAGWFQKRFNAANGIKDQ